MGQALSVWSLFWLRAVVEEPLDSHPHVPSLTTQSAPEKRDYKMREVGENRFFVMCPPRGTCVFSVSAISFLGMVELEQFIVLKSMWCYVGFEVSSCIYDADGSCVVARQRRTGGCQLLWALWWPWQALWSGQSVVRVSHRAHKVPKTLLLFLLLWLHLHGKFTWGSWQRPWDTDKEDIWVHCSSVLQL